MTDVASPDAPAGITLRPATPDDARPSYDVFLDAAEGLVRTRGWATVRRPSEPPERFLAFRASALRHDPGGFWVADVDGRLVGFGIAVQRQHVWYLAALHVRPPYQSRGVGAALVHRALAAAAPGSLLTVGADARNPASNGLYGQFGMFPQVALLELAGPATPGPSDILRAGAPDAGDLAAIDRATLDVARPEDHGFWASVSNLEAFTVVRDGRAVGYAYVQADGAIGPIAVVDPADLEPAVDASVAIAAQLGAGTARIRIPGLAREATWRLLARGWRYGDAVTLVLTSAPWGQWDRYVSSGADALL